MGSTLTEIRETTQDRGPAGLRVVHVVLSLEAGGLERVVANLACEARAFGQTVAVVCLEKRGVLAAEVEALGVSVLCVFKEPGLRPRLVKRLKGVFEQLAPDVVHTHQIGALLYAGPAARRAGVRTVVHTEHGKHYEGRLRARILGRVAARYADRFFCVSEDIAAAVLRHRVAAPGRTVVCPNGIDAARFQGVGENVAARADAVDLRAELGISASAPVVGTVGRLAEVKSQHVLVKAFARVRSEVPGAHLLLVGDGPLRAELEVLAADLGVSGCTHFVGFQGAPERYIRLMDVFALTSRSEGMPLVVLETWAAGVPVVASAVGGLPELVQHGVTGMLFRAGDDAELARTLSTLLSEPSRAKRMGAAGCNCVRSRYTLEKMTENYARHYSELLKLRPESRRMSAGAPQSALG